MKAKQSKENKRRARVAAIAVKARMAALGDTSDGMETDIVDLLADLGHLCDKIGYDFEDAIRRATVHLDAEREGED